MRNFARPNLKEKENSMSQVGVNDASNAEAAKPVAELADRYSKKGKVVALKNDEQDVFLDLLKTIGTDNIKDWTEGAPADFTNLALVQNDTTKQNRLISIADEDAVFADPTVRRALYKLYVNKVVNFATDDDANPAQFITIAGCFKQKFDIDAYKFLAKSFVRLLKDQGVLGVTTPSLRNAFASMAYAKSQFPRVSDNDWNKLLNLAIALSEKHGNDASIFEHWKATRVAQTADTSIIELDFGEAEMEAELSDDDEAPTEKAA